MASSTELELIREWLSGFTGFPVDFSVDYTDQIPANGGIFPSGLVEVSRRRDILGNVQVQNQLNFGLYYVFEKAPGDSLGAELNAEWLISFQKWVQEQSAKGLAPTFGDYPKTEQITAENGAMYAASDEGTATYMVQLSVKYIKNL